MYRNIFKQNKGFTLIEIIVTIGIFSVIMGAVSLFSRDIFYYNNIFSGGLTSYDEAKKILQPVASEIRSASSSSLGGYSIEMADDNNFIFFTDIDGDGLKERVRYFLDNNTFKKGIIIPSGSPLQYLSINETITDVVNDIINDTIPIFTYYDTSYNGSSDPLSTPISISNIRLVKITLIIDADPNRPPAPMTVTTEVNIRNLKDNL
jgi:prepilin-type N-terminal cleavage/methylation domain-containing protein